MWKKRVSCYSLMVGCLLVLSAGCVQPPKGRSPAVVNESKPALALKFTPGQVSKYRVKTETKRSVTFEGSISQEPGLKGGQTGTTLEMVFTQEVEKVDANNNALVKITIDELKFEDMVKDSVVLSYDSSLRRDRSKLFTLLIGQSYTIELSSDGQVKKIVDTSKALAAVKGTSTASKRAAALLEPKAIKERHSIPALPEKAVKLAAGQEWSKIKTYSFGLMGAKAYERIYVLKEIKEQDGHRIALVEMNAIPTSEAAEQLHLESPSNPFAKMFDSTDVYTGHLKFDATTGEVLEYVEDLKSEWLVVDPMAERNTEKQPDSLRMTAIRSIHLERID